MPKAPLTTAPATRSATAPATPLAIATVIAADALVATLVSSPRALKLHGKEVPAFPSAASQPLPPAPRWQPRPCSPHHSRSHSPVEACARALRSLGRAGAHAHWGPRHAKSLSHGCPCAWFDWVSTWKSLCPRGSTAHCGHTQPRTGKRSGIPQRGAAGEAHAASSSTKGLQTSFSCANACRCFCPCSAPGARLTS